MLSLSIADGDTYEEWAWSLLSDALPLLADALEHSAALPCLNL
ncbi:hypothetical protein V5F32_21055 [Xanthobacter oligotrophicus]|uniref:Uncharacterized protein n=1 Tax=Xanthobacter oligotrophicus TaxID=2607286 RepID=A0ABW7A454_9HYPH